MIKSAFVTAILILTLMYSHAQIQLNDHFQIVSNDKIKSISDFVAYHKLDYALVLWTTSNWFESYEIYSCLFKKQDKWSLVQIKDDANKAKGFPYKLLIQQKALDSIQVDSMLNVLKVDSTFCYKQADYNKLPKSCEYEKDGKKQGLYSIMDADISNLLQFKGGSTDVITFYAASSYLDSCYPYVPQFGILKKVM
jgi:hypothetical protein